MARDDAEQVVPPATIHKCRVPGHPPKHLNGDTFRLSWGRLVELKVSNALLLDIHVFVRSDRVLPHSVRLGETSLGQAIQIAWYFPLLQ